MSLILNGTDGLSDVDGTAATPAIRGTDANTGIFFPAADTIAFSEGGAESMRIDSSGNVGIGLTPPVGSGNYRALNIGATVVYGNTGLAVAAFNNNADINDKYVITGVASSYTQSSGNHLWYSAASGTAGNAISFTERMRIDSSGNLMVNSTSVVDAGRVSITWAGNAQIGIGFKSTFNGSFDVMRFFNFNNVQQGFISCNNSGSTTYNSGSDYRLKDNVKPMIDSLNKVMELKPVTFTWKGDNSKGQGFIAHELAEIVPDAVTGEKDDVTEDGTIKPQGVDYGKLTAILTAAIQELNAKVDAQAIEIAELKAK